MKENLVFLPDSPYSDPIIERSESVVPGKTTYVCLNKTMKYLKSPLCQQLEFRGSEFFELCSKGNLYRRIIIHYHTPYTAYFLAKSKIAEGKVIWVLWSGDLYNTKFFKRAIHQPLTAEVVKKLPKSNRFIWLVQEIFRDILQFPGHFQYKRSYQKFKYIASPFEKDVELANKTFKKTFNHIPFAFLSVDELFDEQFLQIKPRIGNKIMIGHSGIPSNNHLEVFHQLSEIDVPNLLFCPLSYGDKTYISILEKRGKKILGDRVEFFKVFLPKKEYYQKLQEIGFAILNTNVQKGFGNLIGLLFIGVKVFLNKENSIFFQLKKWGFIVKEISEINKSELQTPLTTKEVKHNQKLILDLFNNRKIEDYYASLYQT